MNKPLAVAQRGFASFHNTGMRSPGLAKKQTYFEPFMTLIQNMVETRTKSSSSFLQEMQAGPAAFSDGRVGAFKPKVVGGES